MTFPALSAVVTRLTWPVARAATGHVCSGSRFVQWPEYFDRVTAWWFRGCPLVWLDWHGLSPKHADNIPVLISLGRFKHILQTVFEMLKQINTHTTCLMKKVQIHTIRNTYPYCCLYIYICIYIFIYKMDCVCQRYHKECCKRTRADDCYNCWKKCR